MKRMAGFTLIEMAVAVTIIGILLAIGLPAMQTYVSNARLRSTAHTFLSGLQMARSEAVRRNANVDFVLTNADVSAAGFAAIATSSMGQNWLIRTSDLATFVEGKFGVEGSGRATGQTSPVIINDANNDTVADAGSVAIVTFNGLGRTTLASATTFTFINPTGGACAPAGPMRCLNVIVSVGGQTRLCDPAVTAAQIAAGDTRGC